MKNPPNPTEKFSLKTLLIFSPLLILYIMVLFGFSLRQNIPFEYHYLFPIVFLLFFVLFLLLAPAMGRRLKMKPFYTFGFIVVNVLVLYFNSSIKREYEVTSFVEENEKELLNFVQYFQKNGEDSTLLTNMENMSISSMEYGKGNYHFSLYYNLGYGYGLTYTDSLQLATPKVAPNGSPIIKWIKVKEHWYYYSYFD
ncbi:MAG: hypothetical protein IPO63_10160 [Bacteroidetes bacterium]|nr:hypothetical protein [Bacteroidota bacterium]